MSGSVSLRFGVRRILCHSREEPCTGKGWNQHPQIPPPKAPYMSHCICWKPLTVVAAVPTSLCQRGDVLPLPFGGGPSWHWTRRKREETKQRQGRRGRGRVKEGKGSIYNRTLPTAALHTYTEHRFTQRFESRQAPAVLVQLSLTCRHRQLDIVTNLHYKIGFPLFFSIENAPFYWKNQNFWRQNSICFNSKSIFFCQKHFFPQNSIPHRKNIMTVFVNECYWYILWKIKMITWKITLPCISWWSLRSLDNL